ncbi:MULTISPECIES: LysR family transcriptional regulator [unclassified Dyella]|uniref:LysR family transcriptional regulator n=1 Tax=unclassified Dyella TaxID=2634549 RepID=UPI000C861E7D|nr:MULTISPECIES: LysR family transcriptional regulator [unclassified Dyella]MDR3446372.1 LysR family transcriptional regulator [Dyella sp.]PMQ04466.1 HTH-type transcriptional regulator DmlR [Dyella sp. AD56]
MNRFSDMQLLIDAADLCSMSAAGRRAGLSPAAASACVQRVEAMLGARLFERTTRQLRLTEEGRIYIASCRVAIETMKEAERAVRSGTGEVSGTLRVSAPSDLGRNLLVHILDSFMVNHPDVRVALTLSDSLSRFVPDDIDVAIRVGPLENGDLVARHLADSWRVVCASPTCIATHGMPSRPEDLADLPTLVLTTNAGPRNEWRLGDEVVRVRRYHECTDSEVIRTWAVLGRGFAYRQLWAVAADVQEGRLMLVNAPAWSSSTPIHAMYHSNVFQPLRVRRFVDFLQTEFLRRLPIHAEAVTGFLSAKQSR